MQCSQSYCLLVLKANFVNYNFELHPKGKPKLLQLTAVRLHLSQTLQKQVGHEKMWVTSIKPSGQKFRPLNDHLRLHKPKKSQSC
jgi:hypothetical protein